MDRRPPSRSSRSPARSSWGACLIHDSTLPAGCTLAFFQVAGPTSLPPDRQAANIGNANFSKVPNGSGGLPVRKCDCLLDLRLFVNKRMLLSYRCTQPYVIPHQPRLCEFIPLSHRSRSRTERLARAHSLDLASVNGPHVVQRSDVRGPHQHRACKVCQHVDTFRRVVPMPPLAPAYLHNFAHGKFCVSHT
jgi:hypothetical protein